MENHEAIVELEKLREGREQLKSAVKRKRSWRESEKAFTMANYQKQITALNRAIEALKEKTHATS